MAKPLKQMIVEGGIEIISDPTKWTRGELARGALDQKCDPTKPYAIRWCAIGAMMKFADGLKGVNGMAVDDICHDIYKMFPPGLPEINDGMGRESAIFTLRMYLVALENKQ